jgi:hypothetical protein
MRNRVTSSLVFTLACLLVAATAIAGQSALKPKLEIQKFAVAEQQVAWLAYGLGLSKFVTDHDLGNDLSEGPWAPTFDAEVFARKNQMQIWHEIKEKNAISYEFMEQMELIMEAGFLEEYVWTYYKSPTWPQKDGLRLTEFSQWASSNLKNHQPMSGAKIVFERAAGQ